MMTQIDYSLFSPTLCLIIFKAEKLDLESSIERQRELAGGNADNFEYLKNVVVKYMQSSDPNVCVWSIWESNFSRFFLILSNSST